MVTKNLKNIMRAVPVSINGVYGYIQVKDVYYRTKFMPFNFSSSFPTSLTLSTTLDAYAAGRSIGRGSTPKCFIKWKVERSHINTRRWRVAGMTHRLKSEPISLTSAEPDSKTISLACPTSTSVLTGVWKLCEDLRLNDIRTNPGLLIPCVEAEGPCGAA